jgi:hypothetical protein
VRNGRDEVIVVREVIDNESTTTVCVQAGIRMRARGMCAVVDASYAD